MWINIVGLHVLRSTHERFPMFFTNIHVEYEKYLGTDEILYSNDRYVAIYEPRIRKKILTHAATWSLEDYLEYIKDDGPCQFYGDIIRRQVAFFNLLSKAVSQATGADLEHLEIPEWYHVSADFKCSSKPDFLSRVAFEHDESWHRLIAILKIVIGLRSAIHQAANSACLTSDVLEALKAKLEPFGKTFLDVCDRNESAFVGETKLIDSKSEQWW
ncbi:hypothetical protein BKA66DRAFT_476983 [Pyrenochaeta sp. MPI-SDFR-AT-0127]|nr:hypothetical protein BKA66DRAFT_476983 [Pyrenochaeta sp. MPI-SDFR-AT-0127]